ncbi:Uncharacterised protein [Mycobacteroides abscessus subsp. abscessus]|nr:Uncharacterised protein [Mycobacteroides abscessus subsp. abscessus]
MRPGSITPPPSSAVLSAPDPRTGMKIANWSGAPRATWRALRTMCKPVPTLRNTWMPGPRSSRYIRCRTSSASAA